MKAGRRSNESKVYRYSMDGSLYLMFDDWIKGNWRMVDWLIDSWMKNDECSDLKRSKWMLAYTAWFYSNSWLIIVKKVNEIKNFSFIPSLFS